MTGASPAGFELTRGLVFRLSTPALGTRTRRITVAAQWRNLTAFPIYCLRLRSRLLRDGRTNRGAPEQIETQEA